MRELRACPACGGSGVVSAMGAAAIGSNWLFRTFSVDK